MKKFRFYVVSLGILLSGVLAVNGLSNSASAVVDNDPDCDTVSIIRCGAFSMDKMREKASQGDVPKVYNAFGISQSDLNGEFKTGIVWKDGRVTIDGKTIATGAMTAGRNYGGTPIPGTNAGKYPTSKFVTEGQTAFIKLKADGTFDFALIKACGNPVTGTPKQPEQPQQPPTFECTKLTVEKINRTKYKFTADTKVSGGATVEKYEFGFGDGYGITVNEKSYTYDYKKTGTFKTNVVIHVLVNGNSKTATSAACEKTITIPKESTPPATEMCQYDETLPQNSPDCQPPVEHCAIKGKENLPKDSDQCKEAATPEAIASTGPEAIVTGLFGSSALGYGAFSYAQSRRHLIKKLLGR